MNRFFKDPDALAGPWFDSPFFEKVVAQMNLSSEERERVERFSKDGILVLEGFFEDPEIDAVVDRYDWLFDEGTEFDASEEDLHVLRGDPYRVQDAWRVCPPVHDLACHPRVVELLRTLYRREPIPFQTLNFLRGTEQSIHSDAFHFSSYPQGFLCGAWVALEDVTPETGPLRYARGSHRLPYRELADLGHWSDHKLGMLGLSYEAYEELIAAQVELGEFPIEELPCKKGTLILWAANLLHGGAPIRDLQKTRHSQVTHYYFDGCIRYTPVHSDAPLGELDLRNVSDLRTGKRLAHGLNGKLLETENLGYADADLFRLRRRAEDSGDAYPRAIDLLEQKVAELELDRAKRIERETGYGNDVAGFQDHVAQLESECERLRSKLNWRRWGPMHPIVGAFKRWTGLGHRQDAE